MIKFLDCGTEEEPVEFILADDKLQDFPGIKTVKEIAVDNSPFVSSPLQSVNELGKLLLKAAYEGNIKEAKYLLSQGTPFTADWVGTTPLHLAAQNNHVEMCELFLKGGMSKDSRNKVDRTPLHMAAYEGYYQVAETLIKHGAEINPLDMLSMTPLHWAVQNGHTAMVELLLRHDAQVNVENKFGLSPQDVAQQINNLEIMELLQAYEGDSQSAAQMLGVEVENGEAETREEIEDDSNEARNNASSVIILDNQQITNGKIPLRGSDKKLNPEPPEIHLEDSINHEDFITQSKPLYNHPNVPLVTKLLDPANYASVQHAEVEDEFSAIKLLQEHGISMLPNDNEDSNMLNAVVASGHSMVLTDVGKEVLKSLNEPEKPKRVPVKLQQQQQQNPPRRVITVTPEQFLSLTEGRSLQSVMPGSSVKVVSVKPNVRRVVMKKTRPTPFANSIKVRNVEKPRNEVLNLMQELASARKTIEEYKSKLKKKEQEVERYKFQLKLLMDAS